MFDKTRFEIDLHAAARDRTETIDLRVRLIGSRTLRK